MAQPDLSRPDLGFAVVRGGYDQVQVDNHLHRLDTEFQILATELDDARARADQLRVQIRNLASPPQNIQGMSDRMRYMLRLAEDEAGEMLRQADIDSTHQLREAEARAAQLISTARAEAEALRT